MFLAVKSVSGKFPLAKMTFGRRVKTVLHGTICMMRFVRILFDFKISSYKSGKIELILSFKNRFMQI